MYSEHYEDLIDSIVTYATECYTTACSRFPMLVYFYVLYAVYPFLCGVHNYFVD